MDDKLRESLDIVCDSEGDLPKVTEQLIDFAGELKVWLFVGDLGAGKTTLIKQVCKQLGLEDEVSSPTFSIINEYLAGSKTLYHFDFYRLNSIEEAVQIGVIEYFDSGNYCFIEWPQKVEQILPEEFMLIQITGEKSGKREIKVKKYE